MIQKYYNISRRRNIYSAGRSTTGECFGIKKVTDYIPEKLSLIWSPEQISKTPCGLKMPSFKTIYRWLYEGYVAKGDIKKLRRKGKTKKWLGNRGRFTAGKSIRKRDKSVYTRKEFGHWEADTVVSGQGKSKACFATLAERKTRFYIAIKIPNRSGEKMAKAVIAVLSQLPQGAVKTITCDRGSVFSRWKKIEEAFHCSVYFADPYCAWQKGTNENLNGLLREFYSKGRNLSYVSDKTLKKNLALLNARPKKKSFSSKLCNFSLNKISKPVALSLTIHSSDSPLSLIPFEKRLNSAKRPH